MSAGVRSSQRAARTWTRPARQKQVTVSEFHAGKGWVGGGEESGCQANTVVTFAGHMRAQAQDGRGGLDTIVLAVVDC